MAPKHSATITLEESMLKTEDLISDRPATMKDVTEVAQATLDAFGEVMMNVIGVCLTAADDPGRRENTHLALISALLSAREQYSENEDIFAAAFAHRLFKTLQEIRVQEAEAAADE
ncbi:hypothetical protein DFQ28_004633 [Apophysomyces sp. BC1034]|nr:hypothetical protein DFQ30_008945 [Apophysomyces sp. BC1015]KAG0188588.1 hypothetical protein DFQ28_004633 [Apophysomyces sp. BC1034]